MIVLLLPYPPGTNNLFFNRGKGRARTQKYNDWIDEAIAMVRRQSVPAEPISHPVSVEMAVGRPDKRRRDIDGVVKPALDLLERAGIYTDDTLVHRLNVWWDTSGDVTGVQCVIMPLGAT